MMFLFVSECEKSGFKHSKKILSKYGTQLGRRTWLARLSKEGLEGVRLELKAKVSRQMSVSCHRLRNNRTSLEWIVGTKKHFGPHGKFAFSWSHKPPVPEPVELQANEKLVRYLCKLAGLFHDVGKANDFFQDKLKKGKTIADPIRHEYVSCLALESLLPYESFSNDREWIQVLESAETALFASRWETGFTPLRKNLDRRILPLQYLDDERQRLPLLFALHWLIVTHHQLTGFSKDSRLVDDGMEFGAIRHTNLDKKPEQLAKNLERNLSPPYRKKFLWEHSPWMEALNQTAKHLSTVCQEQTVASPLDFMDWVMAYGRVALILGDHQVSSEKDECPVKLRPLEDNQILWANTKRNASGKVGIAQPLWFHLTEVGRRADQFFRTFAGLNRKNLLPTLSSNDLTQLKGEPIPKSKPYFWQQVAEDKLLKLENRHEEGFFGVVLAGTGTGKTRGCARIMAHLSQNQRYTIALGLRTLVLQTGTAYREELGLSKDKVGVLVGSVVAKALFELNQQDEAEQGNAFDGVENRAQDAFDQLNLIIETDEDVDRPPLIKPLRDLKEPLQKLILPPVLVATVDHLMGPTDGRRGASVAPSLRLMSSDLILDEIDHYNESDLIPLGKLVYLMGLYGRKVLLSSATLPPAIAQGFFEAYRRGYHSRCRNLGQASPLNLGWFSDFAPSVQVLPWKESNDFFVAKHAEITKRIVKHIQQTSARRCAALLKLDDTEALNDVFEKVLANCQKLHRDHHFTVPGNKSSDENKKVSIGLVRWSNVPPCRWFTQYLFNRGNQEGEPPYRILCYHSQHLPIVLHEIEKTLNSLLKRKDKDTFKQNFLAFCAKQGIEIKDDLMIIVSATTIEETGRDHDFDWGIIEPHSTQSVVQCVGRIWRHRPEQSVEPDKPNVLLLNERVPKYYRKGGEHFAFPGIETNRSIDFNPRDVESLFDLHTYQKRIDAEHRLVVSKRETAPITFEEHQYLAELLLQSSKKNTSLADYLEVENVPLRLTDHHAKANRFRQSEPNELYWQSCEDRVAPNEPYTISENWKQWVALDDSTTSKSKKRKRTKREIDILVSDIELDENIVKNRALLPHLDLNALLNDLIQSTFPDWEPFQIEQQLLSIALANRGQALNFHPQLGLDHRKKP